MRLNTLSVERQKRSGLLRKPLIAAYLEHRLAIWREVLRGKRAA